MYKNFTESHVNLVTGKSHTPKHKKGGKKEEKKKEAPPRKCHGGLPVRDDFDVSDEEVLQMLDKHEKQREILDGAPTETTDQVSTKVENPPAAEQTEERMEEDIAKSFCDGMREVLNKIDKSKFRPPVDDDD